MSVGDRKYFQKKTSDNPSRIGMIKHDDSKTQPAALTKHEGNFNGDGHEFNIKGKSTNNQGSDYHDYGRPSSGLDGNFQEKTDSMKYLMDRNKQGMEVKNFSGNQEQSRLKIGAGPTAYDSMPIPEVYHPATSQGAVPPNAINYETKNKTRNENPNGFLKNDSSSNDKIEQRISKHLKNK